MGLEGNNGDKMKKSALIQIRFRMVFKFEAESGPRFRFAGSKVS